MGQSVSSINQQAQDQQPQLKLNIETGKPHSEDLNPLLNWSLSEIREIYAPFRRRKGSPILTRSQFLRFIRLSRISSFHIYDCLIKTDLVNVFEVLSILVLGAYTGHIYKLQFLFNVFDLKCKKKLSFAELILMYKSIIRGYCFLTRQALPDNQILEKFGLAMFSKADLNNDQLLEIGQIVGWLETATQNLVMFKEYEPPAFGKEEYHIFNCFVPYNSQQINQMTNRLNKVYTKQKLQQQDYLLLKPILKVRKQSMTLLMSYPTQLEERKTSQKQQKLARAKKLIDLSKGDTETFLTGTGLANQNFKNDKEIEEKQLQLDYDPEAVLKNLAKKNDFDDLAQLRRMIKIADQNLGGYQKQINQTLQVVNQLKINSNFKIGRYHSKGNLTEKKASSLARIRDPLYL